MEPIFATPLGKPIKRTVEPAPVYVPEEMPVEIPVKREPVKVPA